MKNILIILFLFVGNGDKITKISKANEAKELAETAFNSKKYDEAIKNYIYLIDSLKYEDPKAQLNLAHSYHLKNDTTNAIQKYNGLLTTTDKGVKSIAHQQLGVISEKNNDLKTALTHFKNALKSNPQNKDARYNYELIKKRLENKANQDNHEKENEKKKEPSEFAKKLKKQADELAKKHQYRKSVELMKMGLQKDETVSNYNDFIKRLENVAEINGE